MKLFKIEVAVSVPPNCGCFSLMVPAETAQAAFEIAIKRHPDAYRILLEDVTGSVEIIVDKAATST